MVAWWIGLALAQSFPVQGVLADPTGGALNGTYTLTFRLYPAQSTPIGSAAWMEADTVAVVAGSFQSFLGDGTAVPPSLLAAPLWLGVAVDGVESERVPVGWAPRAAYAADAGHAAVADDATRVGGQTLAQLDARFVQVNPSSPQAGSLSVTGTLTAADLVLGGSSLSSMLATYLPKSGGALTGALTLAGAPSGANDAATKAYVDAARDSRLALAGGLLSGTLTLAGAPSGANDAATKAYVDAARDSRLALAGGALSGTLTLAGAPVGSNDAATKAYVDSAVSAGVGSASQYVLKDPNGTGDAALAKGIKLGASTVTCDATTTAVHGTLSFTSGIMRVCTPNGWRNFRLANDGSSAANAGRTCKTILQDFPGSPSGRYWVDPDNDGNLADAWQAWCDMTRNGGGWTLVMQNVQSVGSAGRMTYAASTTTPVTVRGGTYTDNLGDFDLLVGLAEYASIGSEARYEVGSTVASPSKSATFTMTVNASDGYRLAVSNGTMLVGSGLPGIYTNHVGYRWSASDVDQDTYSASCEAQYFHPWWYESCWSGSIWGSNNGGYQSAAYWTGSGTDYWAWGALWLR